MAKAIGSTVVDWTRDPYGDNTQYTMDNIGGGPITGGIKGTYTPNSTFIFQDSGTILIGDDFSMPVKEFKICMKMLRKMAMKEMPEEFI